MARGVLATAVLLMSIAAHAERVRVVIAVEVPEVSSFSVQSLRANVIDSLVDASDIQLWGKGRAFAAEIDRADLEWLRNDPRVRAITIDDGGQGSLMQSIPLTGVDRVRAQGLTGNGVTVAVLDTGIDADNPDFAGRVIAQQCFCQEINGAGCCPSGQPQQSGDGAADDDNGHGTHVTGILAGGGASAPAGVAPAARIVAVKVMDRYNSFSNFTQIYRALEWVANERADVRVINMSLGSLSLFTAEECGSTAVSLGMKDVISSLRARGVLIAAATGNQGSKSSTSFPACMSEVLGVGAVYDSVGNHNYYGCTDASAQFDDVTCFTNSSDAVDIVAPGSPIAASRRGGGSIVHSGTSMAAPHVAGVIALMQQASGGKLTADQTEQILKSTGKLAYDPRSVRTFPSLDAEAAIAATPKKDQEPRRRAVRP